MLRRLPEAERRDLVRGLLHGRYRPLDTEEKLRFCLHPGSFRKMSAEDAADVGMVLGDEHFTVGSHVLAGVGPLYAAWIVVSKADWKLIATAYNQEMQRLEKIKV